MDNQKIWRRALKQSFSGAGIALASSFFAIGTLLNDVGWSLWESIFCSFIVFALPGQLTAAELSAHEAGLVVIGVSVLLVNFRLLPMTVALMPLLRPPSRRDKYDWLIAHLIAVTSWVSFMSTYQQIPLADRYRYFALMGIVFWLIGIVATVAGYFIASALPPWLLTGLLFLNPLYFLMMMLNSVSRQADKAAMVLGLLLLLPMRMIDPHWDIIICGIVGGGVAFYYFDYRRD